MKAHYIEITTGDSFHKNIQRLGKATALTPLKVHFMEGRGRAYVQVPEDITPEKFVCAAKDRGLDSARLSVSLTVLEKD